MLAHGHHALWYTLVHVGCLEVDMGGHHQSPLAMLGQLLAHGYQDTYTDPRASELKKWSGLDAPCHFTNRKD